MKITDYKFLNLGCGHNILDYYLNIDEHHPDPKKDKKYKNANGYLGWTLETSDKNFFDKKIGFVKGILPSSMAMCYDNSLYGVYIRHFIEHLSYCQAAGLMRLIYDKLSDGGWLYICAPYSLSLTARKDPSHQTYYCEGTMSYFDKSLQKCFRDSGYGPSSVPSYNFKLIGESIRGSCFNNLEICYFLIADKSDAIAGNVNFSIVLPDSTKIVKMTASKNLFFTKRSKGESEYFDSITFEKSICARGLE